MQRLVDTAVVIVAVVVPTLNGQLLEKFRHVWFLLEANLVAIDGIRMTGNVTA
jgi:hypothetical protein